MNVCTVLSFNNLSRYHRLSKVVFIYKNIEDMSNPITCSEIKAIVSLQLHNQSSRRRNFLGCINIHLRDKKSKSLNYCRLVFKQYTDKHLKK